MKIVLLALCTIIYVFFPWVDIFGERFRDLENYIYYFTIKKSQCYILSENIFNIISNEILWDCLNKSLGYYLNSSEFILLVQLLISFLIINFFYTKTGPVYTFLMMLNPLMLDITHSQIRNGLALGVLLTSVIIKNNYSKAILAFTASAIHVSIFPVVLLIFFYKIFLCNCIKYKLLIYYVVFLVACIFLLDNILSLFKIMGDTRRMGILDGSWVTPKMVAIWSIFLFITLIGIYVEKISIYNFIAVTLLTLFVLGYFYNFTFYRYVSIAFPFLSVAIYRFNNRLRFIGISLIIFEGFLHFYNWSGIYLYWNID